MTQRTILCIDDEATGLMLRKMILESAGFDVRIALSGKDGLKALTSSPVDAVVLDYNMPEMDGVKVARQMRRSFPDLPIIMLSGYTQDIPVEVFPLLDSVVTKGGSPDEMLSAIRSLFDIRDANFQSMEGEGKRDNIGDGLGEGMRGAIDNNPYAVFGASSWVPELLKSVLEATAADFGNVQILDSSRQGLRIVAQQGFGSEFLTYFETVCSGHCACGAAMSQRTPVIVRDVTSDLLFQGSHAREVMLRANVRSCQSFPLVSPSGTFIGVVSTHFNRPSGPSSDSWRDVDVLTARFMRRIQ